MPPSYHLLLLATPPPGPWGVSLVLAVAQIRPPTDALRFSLAPQRQQPPSQWWKLGIRIDHSSIASFATGRSRAPTISRCTRDQKTALATRKIARLIPAPTQHTFRLTPSPLHHLPPSFRRSLGAPPGRSSNVLPVAGRSKASITFRCMPRARTVLQTRTNRLLLQALSPFLRRVHLEHHMAVTRP